MHDPVTKNNLLHDAALTACETNDIKFFVRLLDLNFPLYTKNKNNDFPSFLLVNIKQDSKFLIAYQALLEQDYDLLKRNYDELDHYDGTCFLEKFFSEGAISVNKVNGLLHTNPVIDQESLN